jgi:DNA invertase Pin-like site-specific DNA recombinase
MVAMAKLRGCISVEDWHKQLLGTERIALREHELRARREKAGPLGKAVFVDVSDNSRERLSAKAKTEMKALRDSGESVAALARRFNVSRTTARRVLKPEGASGSRFTPEEIQTILFLRTEGMSAATISQRFNCSESTIGRIFTEYDSREHNAGAVQPGEHRVHGRAVFLAPKERNV